MNLDFLEDATGRALTKSFTLDEAGELEKSSYPLTSLFTSHRLSAENLEQFAEALANQSSLGHCLLKGNLTRPLQNERRANTTIRSEPTEWIVLDIDKSLGHNSPEAFISTCLPDTLHRVSYIWQPSCSAGMGTDALSGHIFMLLENPAAPDSLKNWIYAQNFTQDALRSQLTLSANGMTLRYTLDPSTCQSDKLIYIAPPDLGPGIEDPIPNRINLVRKELERAPPLRTTLSRTQRREHHDAVVAALRATNGLEARTAAYQRFKDVEVLANPDQAVFTPWSENEDFVHGDLNTGDSHAYYHFKSDPAILYNFKGEPAVRLADIDPEYHEDITNTLITNTSGFEPNVFIDKATDKLFIAEFDRSNDRIICAYETSSKDRAKDFYAQYGTSIPSHIPFRDYEFLPTENWAINEDELRYNRYVMSDAMRAALTDTNPPTGLGPWTEFILRHVTGNCTTSYDTLINWLAVAVQRRIKIGTAWVLTGTEGTGKGLFYHHLLRPMFGNRYCRIIEMNDLEDSFNEEARTNLITFFNEVHIGDTKNVVAMMNRCKHMITEPNLRIRGMRQNAVELPSYCNVVMASNHQDAIQISAADRRFNVPPYQTQSLALPPEIDIVEQMNAELAQNTSYLTHYNADVAAARKPMTNDAKVELFYASQNSFDQLITAIREGNLEYFIDYYNGSPAPNQIEAFAAFRSVIERWIAHTSDQDNECIVSRDEIRDVLLYIQGDKFHKPGTFVKSLTRGGLHLKQMKLPGTRTNVRGIRVKWLPASNINSTEPARTQTISTLSIATP